MKLPTKKIYLNSGSHGLRGMVINYFEDNLVTKTRNIDNTTFSYNYKPFLRFQEIQTRLEQRGYNKKDILRLFDILFGFYDSVFSDLHNSFDNSIHIEGIDPQKAVALHTKEILQEDYTRLHSMQIMELIVTEIEKRVEEEATINLNFNDMKADGAVSAEDIADIWAKEYAENPEGHENYKKIFAEAYLKYLEEDVLFSFETIGTIFTGKELHQFAETRAKEDFLEFLIDKQKKPGSKTGGSSVVKEKVMKRKTNEENTIIENEKAIEITRLEDIVEPSDYKHLISILIAENLIDEESHMWNAEKTQTYLIGLLKFIRVKGYFNIKRKVTAKELSKIAMNNFGVTITPNYNSKIKCGSKILYPFITLAPSLKTL